MKLFKNKYEVYFGVKMIGDGPLFSFAEAADLALERLNLIRNHPLYDELAYMEIMIEKWHWFNRVFRPHQSTLIFWSQKEKKFIEMKNNNKYVSINYKSAHRQAA